VRFGGRLHRLTRLSHTYGAALFQCQQWPMKGLHTKSIFDRSPHHCRRHECEISAHRRFKESRPAPRGPIPGLWCRREHGMRPPTLGKGGSGFRYPVRQAGCNWRLDRKNRHIKGSIRIAALQTKPPHIIALRSSNSCGAWAVASRVSRKRVSAGPVDREVARSRAFNRLCLAHDAGEPASPRNRTWVFTAKRGWSMNRGSHPRHSGRAHHWRSGTQWRAPGMQHAPGL